MLKSLVLLGVKLLVGELLKPKDRQFKAREIAPAKFFNGWRLVELGALENTYLIDALRQIYLSEESEEAKTNQMVGLRYQALAMAIRTKRGRIPLDWQNQDDLMYLARFPYSKITPALDQVAELSKIPFISPTISAEMSKEKASESESTAAHNAEAEASDPNR